MLSRFYSDLKRTDQRRIANECFKIPSDILASWLQCCTDLRNICAHYGRLYYRTFAAQPKTPKKWPTLDTRLFDYICIIKALYPKQHRWKTDIQLELEALIAEYLETINLYHIGFPVDWAGVLDSLHIPLFEKTLIGSC